MDLNHIRFEAARPHSPARFWGSRSRLQRIPIGPTRDTERVGGLPATVLRRAGLDPDAYHAAPLRRRVAACLRALRAGSEDEAGAALERSPARIELAVSTLLIGVTDFFRDAGVFEMLSGTVVPALARRGGPVGVLSAGCSSGAELYSVAMLLDEARLLDQATLLGVDCRRDAVVRAREGLFDETLLATLAPEQRARYFEAERGGGRAIGRLRVRTEWRVLDVVQSVPDGPWDIALCRNLLMYLRSDAADAVCRSLAARLAPGGVLVLGRAERPPAGLPLTLLARCVYQRR